MVSGAGGKPYQFKQNRGVMDKMSNYYQKMQRENKSTKAFGRKEKVYAFLPRNVSPAEFLNNMKLSEDVAFICCNVPANAQSLAETV